MAHIVVLLGGARSGKSRLAEKMAKDIGGDSVLFVATAEAHDHEMKARIENHRRVRPNTWRTLEAPLHVGRALASAYTGERVVVIDCVTLWVANVLATNEDLGAAEAESAVYSEVRGLLETLETLSATVIIVSNEVGLGVVPPYPLGRLYRDVLGTVNQRLAAAANEVLFLVAGIPLTLKNNV